MNDNSGSGKIIRRYFLPAGIFLLLLCIASSGCICGTESAEISPQSSDEADSVPYIVLDTDPGCDDVFACFLAAKVLTEPDM
ncbi:MAG TPA: hypothetical protein O0Y17_00395, partial [Methanocorpusculum sp.]|nr:hypothetical protein [Methanocorpusculum sp.]